MVKNQMDANERNKNHSDTAYQPIYRKIRERICLFQYPPGEMLSENTLAAEFGVSRTPIRRALQQLEFEDLVTSKQGIGTIVTILDLKLLKEVYALRIKLAGLIGDLSSPPPAGTDFGLLDKLLARCEGMRDQQNIQELAQINMEFNDALMRMISNKPFREISDQLYYQTARVWPQILPDMDWAEEVDYMCVEIRDITGALRRGNMQEVSRVRRDQITMSLQRIQRYLAA